MASTARRLSFNQARTAKENLMRLISVLPCSALSLSLSLLLAGCAADAPNAQKTPAVTLDHVMADADTAARAGQYDKALQILKGGTVTFPKEKAPWLQMAQMKFDRASYGDAIGNALEALQRDPDDTVANSIVIVSGLRLSTRALADLTRQNNLNGSLRSEAQTLARVLRNSLGEDVLVPAQAPRKTGVSGKPPSRGTAAVKTAPAAESNGADPFSTLK
jgi:predicted Zn-dependent protease